MVIIIQLKLILLSIKRDSIFYHLLLIMDNIINNNSITDDDNNSTIIISSKKSGRPKNKVWEHFTAGPKVADGHFSATCNWCDAKWARAERITMESHLASHCNKAPPYIIREYIHRLAAEDPDLFVNKKRKTTSATGHQSITDYLDSIKDLPEGRISRINRTLIKAFICCGIAFHIIENPFFVDFLNELNPAYKPPTREYLSNRLMEEELAKVNYKVDEELKNSSNLTLGK